MSFKEKYGPVALIAGGSEGLGAAWAQALAQHGLDLILIARRKDQLETFAATLSKQYPVKVTTIDCDLAADDALQQILAAIGNTEVNFMVYNAALANGGLFLETDAEQQVKLAQVNIITPIKFIHHFGKRMTDKGRGGMVIMSSLAAFQGSGYLSMYAASKAFDRILAEGLWYEWKNKGVDVIGCCPGATSTPNYIETKPPKTSFFAPRVQSADEVVSECLVKLGKVPSFISGRGNRWATFFMSKVFSRKMAVNVMSDTAGKMYGVNQEPLKIQ